MLGTEPGSSERTACSLKTLSLPSLKPCEGKPIFENSSLDTAGSTPVVHIALCSILPAEVSSVQMYQVGTLNNTEFLPATNNLDLSFKV